MNLELDFIKDIVKKEDIMGKFLNELGKYLENKKNNKEELNLDFKREGEIYEVDEIGDDEKYIFLTRTSDQEELQEFNISDELYNELLESDDEILRVIVKNGEYEIYRE